ncbi:MAG: hypothetical protein HYR60_04090 [Acidobacteria bacterium]|nr:hypothetical protein [Acidobacteriota bacterium]
MKNVIAEIVSLSGYESQVSALLNEEERMAMEFFIACAPEDHPVIPGAGGFRKARWSRRKGKSGGLRVVYFFLAEPGRIYMAAIEPVGGRSERARKTRGADQKSGKGRAIIMGVRNSSAGARRRTKLGLALERGAREILAHSRGRRGCLHGVSCCQTRSM